MRVGSGAADVPGTSERVAELFDRHAPAVFGYLSRRLGGERAEDATAETFRIAIERLGSYDDARGEPLPWLLGIATNVVRRAARDEERWLRAMTRVGPVAIAREGDRDGAGDAAAAVADVGAALASLAVADRDVVLLVLWEDLTYEQAAVALGVPVGTVRSRLHRARGQLRAALKGDCDG